MQNKAKGGERRRKGRGSGGGEREEEVRSKTIRKKTALHFLLLTNYNMRWAPSEQDRCLEVPGPLDRGVDRITMVCYWWLLFSCSVVSDTLWPPWTVAGQAPLPEGFFFQARILQWVTISFSRGSSQPRDLTQISCTGRQIRYRWATTQAH